MHRYHMLSSHITGMDLGAPDHEQLTLQIL